MYLIGAVGALAIAAIALAVALLFHVLSLVGAKQETVPETIPVIEKPLTVEDLDALFSGPQALRIDAVPVQRPLNEGDVVARFAANTPFGMAAFPDGFQIIGGDGAALVKESADPTDAGGTVLRATPELAKLVAGARSSAETNPLVQVRFIAVDAKGNQSAPATAAFRVSFAEQATRSSSSAPTEVVEDVGGPEELKAIATKLAAIAAPKGTPENFDAYVFALEEPARCDATGDAEFSADYVRAFRHLEKKLTASNLGTFYKGLCDAWKARTERAAEERRAAEAARDAVIQRNATAVIVAQARSLGERAVRNTALAFVAFALAFFMVIALFLAFLAIEGHSNALREALQAIARQQRSDGHA